MPTVRAVFAQLVASLLILFSVTVHADALENILERGEIRIGVSLFTPWAMQDKAGELHGFEIEVANRLAQDMGVKPAFRIYVWKDIIPALKKGEIDVIVAGMAITPARALQINFTRPYAEAGVSLAANTKLTKTVADLRDLNSPAYKIVTVAKTLGDDLAGLLFDKSDRKAFATSEEAEQAILAGQAHAYVASKIETTFLALQHPDKVDLPLSKPLLVSAAGMGVKRGEQELLNFLNAWITARSADKWLDAAYKHWFESLAWRRQDGA
jgi:polar amino acid transport system substrate-binding protein